MAETAAKSSLRKLPEFKALEAVYCALTPLDPEGRRKVIEAIHALLKISPGKSGAHQGPGQDAPRRKR